MLVLIVRTKVRSPGTWPSCNTEKSELWVAVHYGDDSAMTLLYINFNYSDVSGFCKRRRDSIMAMMYMYSGIYIFSMVSRPQELPLIPVHLSASHPHCK